MNKLCVTFAKLDESANLKRLREWAPLNNFDFQDRELCEFALETALHKNSISCDPKNRILKRIFIPHP
jgi:hypothetical protein